MTPEAGQNFRGKIKKNTVRNGDLTQEASAKAIEISRIKKIRKGVVVGVAGVVAAVAIHEVYKRHKKRKMAEVVGDKKSEQGESGFEMTSSIEGDGPSSDNELTSGKQGKDNVILLPAPKRTPIVSTPVASVKVKGEGATGPVPSLMKPEPAISPEPTGSSIAGTPIEPADTNDQNDLPKSHDKKDAQDPEIEENEDQTWPYPKPPQINRRIMIGIENLEKTGAASSPEDEPALVDFLKEEGVSGINQMTPVQKWGKAMEIAGDKFRSYLSEVSELASRRAKEQTGLDDEPDIDGLKKDPYSFSNRSSELIDLLNNQASYDSVEFKDLVRAKINQIEDARMRANAIKFIAKEFGFEWNQVEGDLKTPRSILKDGFFDNVHDSVKEAEFAEHAGEISVPNSFRTRVSGIKEEIHTSRANKEDEDPELADFDDVNALLSAIRKAHIDEKDPLLKVENKLREAAKLKAEEIIDGKGNRKPKKKKSKDDGKIKIIEKRNSRIINKRNGLVALGAILLAAAAIYGANECDDNGGSDSTPLGGVAVTRTFEANATETAQAQATATAEAIGADIAKTSGQLSQEEAKQRLDLVDGTDDDILTLNDGGDNYYSSTRRMLSVLGAPDEDVQRFQRYITEDKYNFDEHDTNPSGSLIQLPTDYGNFGADAITLIARADNWELPTETRVELQNDGVKGIDTTISLIENLVEDESNSEYESGQVEVSIKTDDIKKIDGNTPRKIRAFVEPEFSTKITQLINNYSAPVLPALNSETTYSKPIVPTVKFLDNLTIATPKAYTDVITSPIIKTLNEPELPAVEVKTASEVPDEVVVASSNIAADIDESKLTNNGEHIEWYPVESPIRGVPNVSGAWFGNSSRLGDEKEQYVTVRQN